jgi:hypothetical protein
MTSALRGRDSEVRAVLALLGRARAGHSGALVIRGEPAPGRRPCSMSRRARRGA